MYVELTKGKFLVSHQIKKIGSEKKQKVVELPKHHMYVIDCSGSMSSDIPKIREHVKNKLPSQLGVNDLLTVIWFSGKGEAGCILESEKVTGLKDLARVNGLIDRWLKPVGMTGFFEPLSIVSSVIEKTPGTYVNSLVFMSDGQDNQWPRESVYKVADELVPKLGASTIVEYGYYADRQMMSELAVRTRGVHLFADNFTSYEPLVNSAFSRAGRVNSTQTMSIDIEGAVDLIFSVSEVGDIIVYKVIDKKVTIPASVESVYYVSDKTFGKKLTLEHNQALVITSQFQILYAGLVVYATRMKSDAVYALLGTIKDLRFNNLYQNCFGKQKYSEFIELAREAVTDTAVRFVDGTGEIPTVDKNMLTVLGILEEIDEEEVGVIKLRYADLTYSPISRGKEDAVSEGTSDAVKLLTEKISSTRNKKELKTLNEELNEILEQGKFVSSESDIKITNLIYNEDRANVSIQTMRSGDVKFKFTPELGGTSKKFDTTVVRNYAIVKDGMVNVKKLPLLVKVGSTFHNFVGKTWADKKYVGVFDVIGVPVNGFIAVDVNIDKLPLVNRAQVESLSAVKLFKSHYAVTVHRASQKVFNYFLTLVDPKKLLACKDKISEQVGKQQDPQFATLTKEQRLWLKEQGLSENWYSQKYVAAPPSGDVYSSKELIVSIASLSTLPKVEDVLERLKDGKKLTPIMELMVPAIDLAKDLKLTNDKDIQLLIHQQTKTSQEVKHLLHTIAEYKYTAIVSQSWFSEFESIEQNELELELGKVKRKCVVKMTEKEVKI